MIHQRYANMLDILGVFYEDFQLLKESLEVSALQLLYPELQPYVDLPFQESQQPDMDNIDYPPRYSFLVLVLTFMTKLLNSRYLL